MDHGALLHKILMAARGRNDDHMACVRIHPSGGFINTRAVCFPPADDTFKGNHPSKILTTSTLAHFLPTPIKLASQIIDFQKSSLPNQDSPRPSTLFHYDMKRTSLLAAVISCAALAAANPAPAPAAIAEPFSDPNLPSAEYAAYLEKRATKGIKKTKGGSGNDGDDDNANSSAIAMIGDVRGKAGWAVVGSAVAVGMIVLGF